MKGFSFRLDRILRLRENAEQRQAVAYGEAARTETELDRLCEAQADYLRRIGDRLAQTPGQQTNAGLLQVLSLTASAAAQQLDQAKEHLDEARTVASTELDRLAQARVERKSLERIRVHRHAAWKEAAGREEQKESDEVAARTRSKQDS
jgi:flagellar export protein FliJ